MTENTSNKFNPSQDIVFILNTLRQEGLEWIAQEIEDIIREGKTVKKELGGTVKQFELSSILPYEEEQLQKVSGNQKKKEIVEDSFVLPYEEEEEQLQIVVRVFRNYFVGTYSIWSQSLKNLREALGNEHVTIQIIDKDETSIDYDRMFTDDFSKIQKRMSKILDKVYSQKN